MVIGKFLVPFSYMSPEVNPIQLNVGVSQHAPFEARYLLKLPTTTDAPRAATRISKPRAGQVVRSDPFVQALDRKGLAFRGV